MARLVRIVDAVAVLRPVHDAHVVVADATRVLAVFIITRAAAVLHRCSCSADSAMALLVWAPLGVVLRDGALRGVDVRSDGGRMWLRSASTACLACFLAARSKIELASRDTLASKKPVALPVDAVA